MSQSTKEFLKAYYEDQEYQAPQLQEAVPLAFQIWNQPVKKQPLSLRTKIALLVYLFLTPFVIYFGIKLGDRDYLTVSLLLMFMAMAPFFLIFERRKPKARELIVIAVLVGLAVGGRAAFFMLPQFKPVAAIVIIAAVAFGPESGFLVGALTALVSNIFFSQGPWTPWQMFAFGMIGFVAGLLYRKGLLKPTRLSLSIFGFFAVFLIYGGIMNPASMLMFSAVVTKEALIAMFISGAPMDLVHASSTFIFLFVLAKPMLEKLARIKIKYGLIEEAEE